ncbi:hypothetical protein HPT25_15330 [Bacillus sp. BRMEA1]|uniref:hypothetical protein n=1 Tax=Neobacillus endophyticus TaxID=2738405 RepID=UPI001563120A|nr:hypothetical protein [Neobacillus endophyticus]NRD78733.1 hypothetical protein [Neobacillus endophyticus]
MTSLHDVLYNWLTIKVVCDARPEDTAAKETLDHFDKILHSEYEVEKIDITKDDVMYFLSYQHKEEEKKTRFPRELIEIMLNQINKEPEKYVNFE